MKINFYTISFLTLLFGLNSPSFAESLPTLSLSPSSNSFSTSANNNPTYPAWTYPTDHDIWTFDLTAFDPNYLVSIDLTLGDYCCHADDYNLYWDGSSIGTTGFGIQKLFELDTTAAIHTLEVDWLNPISGGSWYNISINALSSEIPSVGEVPIPAAAFMFAPALLGFMGLRRKAKNSLA